MLEKLITNKLTTNHLTYMSMIEQFSYDNTIVRKFAVATVIFGRVGMLVGLIAVPAVDLSRHEHGDGRNDFGRIRPLHTNAAIFAFVGNGIFAGVYHSLQRLLKPSMFSTALSNIHFLGWQAIIAAAAITPCRWVSRAPTSTPGLEWPIDIAIALIWVVLDQYVRHSFERRENHLYVAIWFYIATWVTVTVLHIGNNWSLPSTCGRATGFRRCAGCIGAGGGTDNAVAFFLTTLTPGFDVLLHPESAANRPVYSYKTVDHSLWALIFIYLGRPHHLLYTRCQIGRSRWGWYFPHVDRPVGVGCSTVC
ncbi:MAG: cbb3-type cytochrome c oxidase subunit I [Saprospiraceae bacterium]